jgi:hypothetical protein
MGGEARAVSGERSAAGIAWAPQAGPQHAFVNCPVFEVVYGGARGGGKTDAVLGEFAIHAARYGAGAKGLMVRRSGVALIPTIERARAIYLSLGAIWQEAKNRFRFPGGAVLYFRHLENLADADLYMGHDYTRVYIEELTQFPTAAPVDKLKGTLRSAAGVPCGMRSTCNPGGPGHTWVKARYIDPGPYAIVKEPFVNPFTGESLLLSRVFIPARLDDNPSLLANDPLYVARLQLTGSKELVRAWLEGDWDIIEGAFFDGWSSARNVVKPFAIPLLWTKFIAFDWGYARPFSVGWWAVATDPYDCGNIVIPRGGLVRYREWYGCSGTPNEGLRLEAEAVARGIAERNGVDRIAFRIADPSILREDGGPSIGQRMAGARLATDGVRTVAEDQARDRGALGRWRGADNTRVPQLGAFGGWDQVRARIKGTDEGPMLVVFETCRDFIRTVPVLQHDPDKAEDLDTDAEDHIADETRYACLSRPLTAKAKQRPNNPRDLGYGRRPQAQTRSWKTT